MIISTSVSPLNVTSTDSNTNTQLVGLILVNNNGLMTLQWGPFAGTIAANGATFLTFNQGIPYAPKHTIEQLVSCSLRGETDIARMTIGPDPSTTSATSFRIRLPAQGNVGDMFSMSGGTISWFIR